MSTLRPDTLLSTSFLTCSFQRRRQNHFVHHTMVAGDSPSPPRRQRRRPGGPLPVISDSLPYTSRVFRSPETEPKVARPISEQLASVFDPRQPSRRGEDSLDNSDISANQVKEGAQFAAHLGPDDPCDKRGERVLTGQQRSVARQSRRLSQSTIPSPVHDLRDNRQESLSQDRGNFSDVYKELYNSTSHAHSSRAMHDRPAVEKRSVEQPPGVNWSRTADWAAVQLSTSAEGHHDDQSTSSESTRHSRGSSYDSESALPDILPQFSERTLRKSPRTQQTIDSAQRHERRRPHRTDKQKILYGRHRARKLPIIRSSDSDSDSSDVDGDTDINEHATSNATSAKLHRISHCRPLPPFLGHSQLDPNTNLFDSGMAGQNPPALSLETSGEFSDNARCSGPKSSRKNRGACQLFLASISDTAFCEASTTYKRKAKNEIDHRKASKRRITTCAPPETIFIELEREQIWPNRRRRQPLIHSSTPTLELLRVDQVEDEAAPKCVRHRHAVRLCDSTDLRLTRSLAGVRNPKLTLAMPRGFRMIVNQTDPLVELIRLPKPVAKKYARQVASFIVSLRAELISRRQRGILIAKFKRELCLGHQAITIKCSKPLIDGSGRHQASLCIVKEGLLQMRSLSLGKYYSLAQRSQVISQRHQ